MFQNHSHTLTLGTAEGVGWHVKRGTECLRTPKTIVGIDEDELAVEYLTHLYYSLAIF